jgi:hypothetical protein
LGDITLEWHRRISAIVDSDDELKIVEVVPNPVDLLILAGECQATVVVLMKLADEEEPGICSHLLMEHNQLLVLLLPRKAGPPVVLRMTQRRDELSDASNQTLHAALKGLI